jgi:L-lactate dehydrogenase complex protein LldG
MSARDRILAKLKAAPLLPKVEPDVAGWFAGHRPVESTAEKITRFRKSIEFAHAEVHPVSRTGWLAKLQKILAEKGIATLLVAPGTPHGQRAQAELPAQGIACPAYDQPIEAWKETLFHDIPASLTTARAAIAETGTLILWPDEHEPRLMSLVPPVHVVLLDASKIYDTFYEAAQAETWKDGLPTNALLISGPSKTADIQVTLAYGAHGPKELVVLLTGEQQ